MVNFKLRRNSFKNKKQVPVDPADRKVFPNMQPAIIDRNQWQLVQDKMKRIQRKHPNMKHGPAVFKGFLYCGECGCKCYARQSKDHYVLHYVCSGYARNTASCTIHYISDNVLRRRVLKTLRGLLDQFRKDEAAFITRLQGFRQNTWKTEITEKQRTIDRLHSDIFDLERKLRKAFDDKNSGIVSDAAFQILSDQIIEERKSLLTISEQLEKEVQEMRSSSVQIQSFIDVLKKYRDTDVTEITQTLLLDFVDKILIHDSDAKYEYTQQKKIDIYLRAVALLDV